MSTKFDKNSSKWSYYSTDHKNYIKNFSEHHLSKLLDPQRSTFGDVISGIKPFLKMKLSENSFYKSWAPKLIFSNEILFRKIRIIFDKEKWLWKSEIYGQKFTLVKAKIP